MFLSLLVGHIDFVRHLTATYRSNVRFSIGGIYSFCAPFVCRLSKDTIITTMADVEAMLCASGVGIVDERWVDAVNESASKPSNGTQDRDQPQPPRMKLCPAHRL